VKHRPNYYPDACKLHFTHDVSGVFIPFRSQLHGEGGLKLARQLSFGSVGEGALHRSLSKLWEISCSTLADSEFALYTMSHRGSEQRTRGAQSDRVLFDCPFRLRMNKRSGDRPGGMLPDQHIKRGRVIAGRSQSRTGFQRFPAHRNAATADEVCTWLDARCERIHRVTPPRPLTSRAETGLASLDSLALVFPWKRDPQLLRVSTDGALRYVLGLDQRSASTRLRAIVARAYTEAEKLSNAYADYLGQKAEIKADISKLSKQLPWLKTALPRRTEGLARWRWMARSEADAWVQGASDCVSFISELHEELRAQQQLLTGGGRTKDWGALFLVARLGEAFAFWTAECPAFSWNQKESKRRRPTAWQQLLQTSFEIYGLNPSLGHLLRTVPSAQQDRINEIAEWAYTDRPRQNWTIGDCRSVGILNDWAIPRGGGRLTEDWEQAEVDFAGLTHVRKLRHRRV
jgi:hypothetical protein